MKEGNKIRLSELNKYSDDMRSSKVKEIGKQKFKFTFLRKLKKLCVWYFQDRFGLTINMLVLFKMVL